jgi:S-(hydroxymethyl)glutathione dehydrogenase/alcohol dehydrogenase
MRTKGALIWEFNQPWSIEEIDIGEPRRGEVQIRMEAAGMCHTDHHLVTGAVPMAGFPVLGGHEGAGVVTQLGPDVEHLAVGDHVVLSFVPSCGRCPACHAGLRNLCDAGAGSLSGASVTDGSFRIQAEGHDVYPMCLLGTFAPYMVVHQTSVVRIDPAIPFEVACLVGCCVTTGYGSATKSAQVRPGDDVAVVGVGGVGMSALQAAVAAGARYVVAVVTVGEVDGHALDKWVGLTAKGGICVLTAVGSLAANNVTLNLSMLTLMQKSLRVGRQEHPRRHPLHRQRLVTEGPRDRMCGGEGKTGQGSSLRSARSRCARMSDLTTFPIALRAIRSVISTCAGVMWRARPSAAHWPTTVSSVT